MPPNVLVIINYNGRSHLVGCSLVSGEKTEDYKWILKQLLAASNNLPPHVIIINEDPSMEAACTNVIGDMTLLNCIWHLGHQNLNKNLHGALGKDWDAFISSFWSTQNFITSHDFEHRSSQHVTVFGFGKPRVGAYLERIFECCEHWAWPWVGTEFTARMQSTQRVEGINSVIKHFIHSKTSLLNLFESIEKMISDEARSSRHLHYKMDMTVDSPLSYFTKHMFANIIDANRHYLGIVARNQMMMEMMQSTYYQSNLHTPMQQSNKIHGTAKCDEEQPSEVGDNEEVSTPLPLNERNAKVKKQNNY